MTMASIMQPKSPKTSSKSARYTRESNINTNAEVDVSADVDANADLNVNARRMITSEYYQKSQQHQ
jgi:hypothetical protein